MAYLLKYEFILDKMRSSELKFYRVLAGDTATGGVLIDEMQDSNIKIEDSINALKTTLENLGGLVTVSISNKNGKEKSEGAAKVATTLKYTVQLKGEGNLPSTNNTNYTNGNSIGIKEYLDILTSQLTTKFEMEKLQLQHQNELQKLKEKEPEIHPLIYEGIGLIKQIFKNEYGNLPITAPAQKFVSPINGPAPEELTIKNEPMEEAVIKLEPQQKEFKDRLNAAITVLIQNDEDFLTHLEMLAQLSVNDKGIYNSAINKLKIFFS